MSRFAARKIIESSTVISASGETAEFADMAHASEVDFFVDIEAVAGGGTVEITLQAAHESGGNWYDIETFGIFTAEGNHPFPVTIGFGKYCRLKYVLTGTSVTVTITAVIKEDI